MLHGWKSRHEERIKSLGKEATFADLVALTNAVAIKLTENRNIWESLGPKSLTADTDPSSNLIQAWVLRKLDTIIPNNRIIINYIEKHIDFLNATMIANFFKFKTHAEAFELHQYRKMDDYPYFPSEFAEDFGVV